MIFTPFGNEILELVPGKVAVLETTGYCFLGLSTTVPNADGSNFNEPDPAAYPSYKRIQVNINEAIQWTDHWGTVSGGEVTNSEAFSSDECLEEDGWPEMVFFGIFQTESGGTPKMGDYLTDPDGEPDENGDYPHKSLKVSYNHVATFRIGTLHLKIK